MADFKAIETQEELDTIIGARLERERKSSEKKYEGFEGYKEKASKYDELIGRDYEGQIKKLNEEHDAKLKELSSKLEEAEKGIAKMADLEARATKAERELLRSKVAMELNVPGELAGRIMGDTEEEMRKDAEGLAKFAQPVHAAPLFSAESGAGKSSADSAFARLSAELAAK